MPKFAANLNFLFTEHEFLDRFTAAARAGFRGVECQFPYPYPKQQIADRLNQHGLELVLHNLPCGDADKGERGFACLPGREREFQDHVGLAIEYASALGCRQLHCTAGVQPAQSDPQRVHATYVANLRHAAREMGKAGIRCLMEPISDRGIPGFYLNSPRQAAAIMDEARIDNLWMQFDIYHAQITEGDLAVSIETHLPRISHMQLADTPGRHEPGTGEINYPFLFGHIDRLGYDGWIGCEYTPLHGTAEGLGWARSYLGSPS